MKKIIAFVFVAIFTMDLHAQKTVIRPPQPGEQPKPPVPQTWLGVFAGPNLNYLDYYDKSTTIEGTNTSFHAGIFYQKNINKSFALQPALLFSIRGGTIKNIDSTINARLINIELPINFFYRYKRLMIGGGPNFCYGINGRMKSKGTEKNAYDATESFERTLKRFEFGGNFIMSYTFKKEIFVNINFSPGFTNIYEGDNSAPGNIRAHTRVFGISLGYAFGIARDE